MALNRRIPQAPARGRRRIGGPGCRGPRCRFAILILVADPEHPPAPLQRSRGGWPSIRVGLDASARMIEQARAKNWPAGVRFELGVSPSGSPDIGLSTRLLPLGGRRVKVQPVDLDAGCPDCGVMSGRAHAWVQQRVRDILYAGEVSGGGA